MERRSRRARRPARVPRPEVVREFPDRGLLWLLENPAHLRGLVEIVEPPLAVRLDFTRARVLNRTLIPAHLRKREADLIAEIPFREREGELWIYLLLEHQSTPEPWILFRLLSAMVRLWEGELRGWQRRGEEEGEPRLRAVIPVVVYTGEAAWERPRKLSELLGAPEALVRFVPGWETLFLNVGRLPAEELARIGSATAMALRTLQARGAAPELLEQRVREALERLPEGTDPGAGDWLEAIWFLLQMALHRGSPEEYTRIEREVLDRTRERRLATAAEAAEMSTTMAELLRQEGRRQGEQGARVAWLEKLLTAKFGPLPETVRRAIGTAEIETLDGWMEAALRAESLEDLPIPSPGA